MEQATVWRDVQVDPPICPKQAEHPTDARLQNLAHMYPHTVNLVSEDAAHVFYVCAMCNSGILREITFYGKGE